jgi:hypothetical protein
MDEHPPLLRPKPRRPFELSSTSPSFASSEREKERQSDFANQLEARLRSGSSGRNYSGPDGKDSDNNEPTSPNRSKSILNLTAGALYGIYSGAGSYGYGDGRSDNSEPATPWGTGAITPARRESGLDMTVTEEAKQHLPQQEDTIIVKLLRVLALFVFGVSYGIIIQHLHDERNIAPVKVQGLSGQSWPYLALWGPAGVGLGMLLPWVDNLWASSKPEQNGNAKGDSAKSSEQREGIELLQVTRLIGGFIGIAFAAVCVRQCPIDSNMTACSHLFQRKLAWKSTLQASVTLALVNPALWYLFDRTSSGFALSSIIGLAGTALILLINPGIVPSPATSTSHTYFNESKTADNTAELIGGVVSYESVGVATWIASVLFCSCICFGNIGRRLKGWRP